MNFAECREGACQASFSERMRTALSLDPFIHKRAFWCNGVGQTTSPNMGFTNLLDRWEMASASTSPSLVYTKGKANSMILRDGGSITRSPLSFLTFAGPHPSLH